MFPVFCFEFFVEVAEVKEPLRKHVNTLDVVENYVEDLIPALSHLGNSRSEIDYSNGRIHAPVALVRE